jgi:D-glycero-D-manno-heptose 1,7-bisphosphate phosphatase
MARAVFLDRDGVINRSVIRDGKPFPPESLSTLEVYMGVAEALAKLRHAGFLLIVVTNQPDVARGTQTREKVEAMHAELMAKLPLDEVMTCYHDGDACNCRKPKPGALEEAKRRYNIDLERSFMFMVGDRWRDIEAGQRVGCTCVFVDHGYSERQPVQPYARVASLAAAAEWILSVADNVQDGPEQHASSGLQSQSH